VIFAVASMAFGHPNAAIEGENSPSTLVRGVAPNTPFRLLK